MWKNALIAAALCGIFGNTLSDNSMEDSLPSLQVRHSMLYDSNGRQVILHGVNEVNKQPPYISLPDTNGFNETHVQFIADHGFSLVRFGIYWTSIEHVKGHYDLTYLKHVKQMIELLARYKIYTLVDFHQDAYAKKHGGLGAPDWAALANIPWTPDMNVGFPLNDFGGATVNDQTVSKVLDLDNDGFWTNEEQIQDNYIKMVSFVVNYLKDSPGILGYDLMNEPSPGSAWVEAGTIQNSGAFDFSHGCPTFEVNYLIPFYKKLITAVHTTNPQAIAWYEPLGMLGLGAPTYINHLTMPNTGFDFHNYMSWDTEFPFQQALSQQHTNRVALLMSEFGASTLTSDQMTQLLARADQLNLSWTEWAYSNNPTYKFSSWPGGLPSDPTKQGIVYDLKEFVTQSCSTNNQCSAVNWNLLATLDRAYPKYIAGNSVQYSYDPTSHHFSLSYHATRTAQPNGQITEIYLPQAGYPNGYRVDQLVGATQLPQSTKTHLFLQNQEKASTVTVDIVPQ